MSEQTYRQKQLYWSLAPNILIALVLLGMVVFSPFDPHRHPVAVFVCLVIYYFGIAGEGFYTIYFARDLRTDEREHELEAKATRSGYAFLSGAIFLLILSGLYYDFDSSPRFLVWLFLIWVTSRIVRDASELRNHAGHTGLWPDFIVEGQRRRNRQRFENPTPRQLETARRFAERQRRKGRM